MDNLNSEIISEFPISVLPGTNITKFQTDPEERIWNGPFTFIQGADTQFGMIENFVYQLKDPKWDKEIQLTKVAISEINAMIPKPKFFVVCGDMLDAFPNTDEEESERRDKQYIDFVKVFNDLDPEIKLICVCGNHDIGNTPTTKTVARYRKDFGPDYFSFWCGGVKFVVLNSQYFVSKILVPNEAAEHSNFMRSIPDANAKHIVVFLHIPLFLNSPDEPENYFSVHKKIRLELLEQFYNYGVRHVFCGHYHKNAGGFYKDLKQVITSAVGCQLGDDKSGFRVVHVDNMTVTDNYVELPLQFHNPPDFKFP